MSSPSDRPSPRHPTPGRTPSFSTLLWLNRHALAARYPAWRTTANAAEPPAKKAS